MRTTFFTAIMFSFLTFSANASEHHIFYSVSVEGHRTVNLNLVSSDIARDLDFDVDVVISAVEKDSSGTSVYVDRSRHLASVRCGAPAKVKGNRLQGRFHAFCRRGLEARSLDIRMHVAYVMSCPGLIKSTAISFGEPQKSSCCVDFTVLRRTVF